MQRHGISRQVQQPSLGSTPHDRVTLLRICPSRSLALDRPQQNTARYPSVVTNRPTTCRLRHHPSLTHQPLYRRTPRCISSIQISQLARGTQIPIAPAAPLHVTLSAVSFLGGFRTPAAEHAAPSLKRPASETLPNSGAKADIAGDPSRANSGLMHRNKIRPIRHLVAAAEHRMRYPPD